MLTPEGCHKDNNIVLDPGAANHVFHDSLNFYSIRNFTKSIKTASGDLIPVTSIGIVRLEVIDYSSEKRSKVIEMEDVWYIPSCTKNLVSGGQLLKKNLNIRSSNRGLSVYSKSGKVVATAYPRGGLFCFNTNPMLSHDLKVLRTMLSDESQISVTGLLQHRFAHMNPSILQNIDVSEFKPKILTAGNLSDFKIDRSCLRSCTVFNSCKQVEKVNRGPVPKSTG
ncbi:hypothetical protein GcM1_087003, partial [Golovinomyces cichoracearum]